MTDTILISVVSKATHEQQYNFRKITLKFDNMNEGLWLKKGL